MANESKTDQSKTNQSKPAPRAAPSHEPSHEPSHDVAQGSAPEQPPLSARGALFGAGLVIACAIVLAIIRILARHHDDTVLAQNTSEQAAPTVSVAPAQSGAPQDSFVLPGNVTAYTDS